MHLLSMLGASITSSRGSGAIALGILGFLIVLAISVLNYVAVFKIITKAGYSGWWILIPLLPPIAYGVSYAAIYHEVSTYNSYGDPAVFWRQIVGWLILVGASILVQWVFFYIFAFSNWPVRRPSRNAQFIQPVPIDVPLGSVENWPGTTRIQPAQDVYDPHGYGSMLTCLECGSALKGGSFCESCGKPAVSAEPRVPPPPVPLVPSTSVAPPSRPQPQPEAASTASARFWETPPVAVEGPTSVPEADIGASEAFVGAPLPANDATCENCGQELLAEDRFCGRCGTPLHLGERVVETPSSNPEMVGSSPQPPSPSPAGLTPSDSDSMERRTGWQPDPFGLYELRYFSADGRPSKLVRDRGAEFYADPPR